MCAVKSWGEPPVACAPSSVSFLRTVSSARIALTSLLSRSTTSCGVPAGATTPVQDRDSYPFRPASVNGGIPGSTDSGVVLVTASALTLPDCASGTADGALSKIMLIWPPTRSTSAWPLPL